MRLLRVKIWGRVLLALIATFPGVKSNILTAEQTVEEIQNGRSLIRFGDGEFGIFAEKNIHYQPYSKLLGKEFASIKSTFERMESDCPYLLAVPKKYMQCSGFILCKKRVLVSSWAESRLRFQRDFDRSKIYGDAFLFQKENACIYGKLWDNPSNKKTIIFIHNSDVYASQFEERYGKTVEFIPCKGDDAFQELEELQNRVMDVIKEVQINSEDLQIIISAGPAGKVLAYHLSMQGYQCIDAGHCWDNPLES